VIAKPEELVEQAQVTSGLSDFGPDGWQEGLERLVDAALDLGDQNVATRIAAASVGRLVTRLRIEDWYTCNPEPPRVIGPVVIMGLPRTATTALQFVLSQDPQFRYQRRWEISDPVPPPERASEEDDPRRLAAIRADEAHARVSVRHIHSVDGPADDGTLLALDFHNQELGWPVHSYTRWWRGASLTSTYAYHERVLRLLHMHRPPHRWLVKAPYHNFHLDDLAGNYPAASFLMTHRDPALAIPSACSTVADAQGDVQDPKVLGAFLLEHLVDGIGRAMDARSRIGENRFLDITQQELEVEPVGTCERIYDFLGLELSDCAQSAIGDWSIANRRGSRGEHRYSAEQFGLSSEKIRTAFARYIEQFNVPEDG
jgi:hypothetical protein